MQQEMAIVKYNQPFTANDLANVSEKQDYECNKADWSWSNLPPRIQEWWLYRPYATGEDLPSEVEDLLFNGLSVWENLPAEKQEWWLYGLSVWQNLPSEMRDWWLYGLSDCDDWHFETQEWRLYGRSNWKNWPSEIRKWWLYGLSAWEALPSKKQDWWLYGQSDLENWPSKVREWLVCGQFAKENWPPEVLKWYNNELSEVIFDLGYKVLYGQSRPLNEAKMPSVGELVLDDVLDVEVRIVDGYSYLRSLPLPYERKILFHLLLSLDVNVADAFTSVSAFSDFELKKSIGNDIRRGCYESKTYRNLMILASAWPLAEPNLCDMLWVACIGECLNRRKNPIKYSHRQFDFAYGPDSDSYYNTINMNYETLYVRSLIGGASGLPAAPNGMWYHELKEYGTLFHEIGHSFLTPAIYCLNYMPAVTQLTMKFVSKFINTSTEADIGNLLTNIYEVWQIYGCLVVPHKGKLTLFINKLSDFDRYAEIGHPFRNDHVGATKVDLMNPSFFSQKPLVKYSINREMFECYIALHGFDLGDYLRRVGMNPNFVVDENLLSRYKTNILHRESRFLELRLPIFLNQEACGAILRELANFRKAALRQLDAGHYM
jgi:hypothetical protein